jgi:hypothetical protein
MDIADPIVNVTTAATLYSQVAGLLAGFAFTALMVYLTRSGRDTELDAAKQRERATALSLTTTLIAFVIISVLYAVLAGGPPASGAAYLGIIIYGVAFALAILSVFHALALLASSIENLQLVVRLTRVWTTVAGPTVSMLLLSSTALDIFFYRRGKNSDAFSQLPASKPFGFGLILTVILLAASVSVYKLFANKCFTSERWLALPSILVLSVSLLAALAAVLLLLQPVKFKPHDALVIVILSAAFMLMLTFSALTAIAQPGLIISDSVPGQEYEVGQQHAEGGDAKEFPSESPATPPVP